MTTKSAASVTPKSQSTPMQPQIQEYSIRVPKSNKKKHNVMRFNAVSKVNFKEWKQAKLVRENNLKDYKETEEDLPKFGAGSEFGREAREEARKKRFGIISKRYKSEDQPWVLKVNGKTGRQFRGIREGGISANASYYVFTHAPDGAIEAFPLNEWYNFQPIQKFKALSAEEAEEEFNRRTKTMNFFNLMLKKRLRNEEDENEEDFFDNEKKKKSCKKSKDLIISDLEEYIVSEEDDSDSDQNEEKKDDVNMKKKKKDQSKKKKKKVSSEAYDESDEADEADVDYMSSDSSNSEFELELQKEEKSVAEEDGLRKILASDEEDDEEEENTVEDDKNEEENSKDPENDKDKAAKITEKKKDKKKSKEKEESDSLKEIETKSDQNKDKEEKKSSILQSSISASPTSTQANSIESPQKKFKIENSYTLPTSTYISGSSESGITEDAVRRYLMRKPMTTTELLQKFKSKKTGYSSEQIVTIMTKILKNINPSSRKIKDKMHFFIKVPHQHQP